MTLTKTSKRLSSRCHVEKYSQVRVLKVSKFGLIGKFISAHAITCLSGLCCVYSLHSEMDAQTEN
jgi:hypothetical protein